MSYHLIAISFIFLASLDSSFSFRLIQEHESKRTTELGNNNPYKTGDFLNVMFVFMSMALVDLYHLSKLRMIKFIF